MMIWSSVPVLLLLAHWEGVSGAFVPFKSQHQNNGKMLFSGFNNVPKRKKTASIKPLGVTSSKSVDINSSGSNNHQLDDDDENRFQSDTYLRSIPIQLPILDGSSKNDMISVSNQLGESKMGSDNSKQTIILELRKILDDIILHYSFCSSSDDDDNVDDLILEISSVLKEIQEDNEISKLLSDMDDAVMTVSQLSASSSTTYNNDPETIQREMEMIVKKVETCAAKLKSLKYHNEEEERTIHLQSFSSKRDSIYTRWSKIIKTQNIPSNFIVAPALNENTDGESKMDSSNLLKDNDLSIRIEKNKIHVNFESGGDNTIDLPADILEIDGKNKVRMDSMKDSLDYEKESHATNEDLHEIISSNIISTTIKNSSDGEKEMVNDDITTEFSAEKIKMNEESLSPVQLHLGETSLSKTSLNKSNDTDVMKREKNKLIEDKILQKASMEDSKIEEENISTAEDDIEPLTSLSKSAISTNNDAPIEIENNKNAEETKSEGDSAEVSEIDVEGSSSTETSVELENSLEATITENDNESDMEEEGEVEEVDIAIVGAGIGGLCAGAILNTLYGKKVGIYESHYLPGGCAHAFDRTVNIPTRDGKDHKVTFTFDSGPTIVLGCSSKPYNPLRQVLNVIGLSDVVEWIPYDKWGMIEYPGKADKELRWKVELGPETFEKGPLVEFGSDDVLKEFQELRDATKGLVSGAVEIPAMAMRSGKSALLPLLRYFPALVGLIQQGAELTQGTFAPFMDGPNFIVKDKWLRDWLDALAFSLSGLPASRTSAAAMAYVIYDMHRDGATLDYPKGGLGKVIDALVMGVEQGDNNSKVNLRSHVKSITTSKDGKRATGLKLLSGKTILAKDGVICNAPVWSLESLIDNDLAKLRLNSLKEPKPVEPRQTWNISSGHSKQRSTINSELRTTTKSSTQSEELSLLEKCNSSEMTGSFLHLHLALDASGLDLESMEAHYTVMDRGLSGDDSDQSDGPCGELNMIAVSNPCVLDRTLAPKGYIVVHAYGAGNEPYEIWKGLRRQSPEYKKLKEERSNVLWRAVESIIPDARERVITDMVGSPITHERFLRRPRGTYGSATEDYLKDGSTAVKGLVLAGDGVFPGIGVPAVALSGASAANSLIDPLKQWKCLDELKRKGLL